MKKDGGHGHGCHCCDSAPAQCSEPDYPWGLRINLDEDALGRLGIKSLPAVGAPVGIEATGVAISVREETEGGKVRRYLELQITDLALAAAGTSKYGAMYEGDPSMKKES